MRAEAWLRQARLRLQAAVDLNAPGLDAQLLLRQVGKFSELDLIMKPELSLNSAQLEQLEALLARRLQGEPVAYLLGQREFYGRDFKVSAATLIPRPDTELLIDLALHYCNSSPLKFVDLGTGTGCVALTLALERPAWQGLAVDISPAALAVAKANGKAWPKAQVEFLEADFCNPLAFPESWDSLDLVVSNPPYVSETEYSGLAKEVRNFEPKQALVPDVKFATADIDADIDAGSDLAAPNADAPSLDISGVAHVQAVALLASRLLRAGGVLLIEHGYSQALEIELWLKSHNWQNVRIHKDLAGHDRVICAHKPA